jgi:hypothetical protein
MIFRRFALCSVLTTAIWLTPAAAIAQDASVRDVLAFLVTNQSVKTEEFVKDQAAAQATSDTIARALLVEVATLPISSSSGGFTYQLNSTLGTMERVSDTFGTFFIDRAVTTGRGQASFGVTYRYASFDRLDGRDLTSGTLVTIANKFRDESNPFDVETLSLHLQSSMLTFVGNFGVTSRFDLGAAIPIVTLRLNGQRTDIYRGATLVQARGSAVSSGLADIAIRAKYQLVRAGAQGLAAGVEVKLPTGAEENLRGTGKTAVKVSAIGSAGNGPFETHFNLALTEGGVSREIGYGGAVSVAAGSRLTLSGELLARRIEALSSIQEVAEPHPTFRDVDTIRLLPFGTNGTTSIAVAGMKWNVTGTLLLNANVLVPLSDRGLRSGVVPSVSLDYAFAR